MKRTIKCLDCDGDGEVAYDVYHRQGFNRDIGYIEEVMETCPTCLGDGTVEVEEYDDE